ncbi:hypothetical protein QC760_010567 [Botrytis cinerea]
MAYIKSKGWANGLSAELSPTCPGSPSIFSCRINLTEDGLKNYKEVVKVFFQYIALLEEAELQKWIFDEQKSSADVYFKFKQKTTASIFTSKTSAIMKTSLPREFLLHGHSRLRKFDGEKISAGLNYSKANNFRMQIASQTFQGGWDSKEKWYGTEYKYEKIPANFLIEMMEILRIVKEED